MQLVSEILISKVIQLKWGGPQLYNVQWLHGDSRTKLRVAKELEILIQSGEEKEHKQNLDILIIRTNQNCKPAKKITFDWIAFDVNINV